MEISTSSTGSVKSIFICIITKRPLAYTTGERAAIDNVKYFQTKIMNGPFLRKLSFKK